MEGSSEAIVEERQEVVISPLGGNPTLRIGYFLKPTSNHIEDSTFELLPKSLFPETTAPVPKPENLPLDAAFYGWLNPPKYWITWEERLHSRYHNLWKKAGILEAIKASTFRLLKDQNLLLGLAQKWYPKTNTFIFPWGEATITLEDVMVLGCYSVLGAPIFTPLETEEQKEKEEKLKEARISLTRTRTKKAAHFPWMRHFMENDNDLEHEAFLSLWLCRFVFPNARDTISERVFPIAIHLAGGTRIALAPPVLASIYRDLSLLNKDLNSAIKWGSGMDHEDCIAVSLWAPFRLVQAWVLERFPSLQPTPRENRQNQPILAKWHEVKTLENDNVSLALDNAGNCFRWRPYTNSRSFKFYGKNANWVFLNSDSDDELLSFAFCLRSCDLVGIECIEQYLPHRVALQFGLDQDVPASVARHKKTSSVAWRNYNKPVNGCVKLYIASFTTKPCVTSQYLDWWKQSKIGSEGAGKVSDHVNSCTIRRSEELAQASSLPVEPKGLSPPPGFPPKLKVDEVGDSALLRSNEKNRSFGNELDNDQVPRPTTAVEDFSLTENVIRESKRARQDAKAETKVKESSSGKKNLSEAKMSASPLCDANGFVDGSHGESSSHRSIDLEGVAKLEARIDEVERIFAELKQRQHLAPRFEKS
ncbi:hypothetical protein L6164_031147 [Bauhinia variegata]|uniref:Uncharacterized protein n=1 Tax=Bauhinia variegata TaxID=167791 RepID=A0ACB9LEJ2_BAUVA|nr:hypothetical protein L6164_031147 [Bauhinia variegata]